MGSPCLHPGSFNKSYGPTGHYSAAQWGGDLCVILALFCTRTFTVPIKWGGEISNWEHLKSYRAALSLISFCGRLFALKISPRHSASRHNAHVVVINHNYHGLKKPQLLFDFKNKP